MRTIHMHHTNRVRPFIIADGGRTGCQHLLASRTGLLFLVAESRATYDARRQAIETEAARSAELAAEQFRNGMKTFLYSCLVAAVGAVDEHSKATLDGLPGASQTGS